MRNVSKLLKLSKYWSLLEPRTSYKQSWIQSWTWSLKHSKEIKQNCTGAENFCIWFCVNFDHYCKCFISASLEFQSQAIIFVFIGSSVSKHPAYLSNYASYGTEVLLICVIRFDFALQGSLSEFHVAHPKINKGIFWLVSLMINLFVLQKLRKPL